MKKQFKIKGWSKLALQVVLISISVMVISFFKETEIWIHYFMSEVKNCPFLSHDYADIHRCINFRGMVYNVTIFVFFIISIFRSILSHKQEDFKIN